MSGKVVVITGAGTGLGRAVARRLGADGEAMVLLGRSVAKIQAVADEIGPGALAIGCDVASPDAVRAAFAAIEQHHGRIDVLINNAAVFEPFLIEEASDAQFRDTVGTNLLGPMLCARSAIPLLRRSKAGLVISVSSESVDLDMPHLVVYEATKAGLERFTRGLRQELGDDHIRATTLRIGSLNDPDKQWDVDPETFGRFAAASSKAGFDLYAKTFSELDTIAGLVRMLIDLPGDTRLDLVTLQGHRAA
ncbi:SDR family oxidoreductase [uncultured Sphingomonas sp.]|uniref:SDR family oxidoreductase n=1 Tax=uncultured Sphingomonas sp. TaxID=158754 RepID=UPI0035CB28A0